MASNSDLSDPNPMQRLQERKDKFVSVSHTLVTTNTENVRTILESITHAQQELNHLTNDRNGTLKKIDQLEQDKKEQANRSIDLDKKLTEEEDKLEQMKKMKAKYEDDMEKCQQKYISLEDEKQKLISENSREEQNLRNYAATKNDLDDQLAPFKEQQAILLKEKEQCEDQIEQQRQEIEKIQEDLKQKESELRQIEDKIIEYEAEERKLNERIRELTERIDELQNTIDIKSKEMGNIRKIQQHLKEIILKIDNEIADINQKKADIEQSIREIETVIQDVKTQLINLNTEQSTLEKARKTLEGELATLEDELTQFNNNLEHDKSEMNVENDRLSQRTTDMKQIVAQIEEEISIKRACDEEKAKTEQIIEQLEIKSTALKDEKTLVNNLLTQAEGDRSAAQTALDTAKKDEITAEATLQEAINSERQLKSQLDEAQLKEILAQQEMLRVQEEVNKDDKKTTNLSEKLKDCKTAWDNAKKAVETLREKYNVSVTNKQNAEVQLSKNRRIHSDAIVSLQTALRAVENNKSIIRQLLKQDEDIQNVIKTQEFLKAKIDIKNTGAEKRREELTTKRDDLKALITTSTTDIDQLKKNIYNTGDKIVEKNRKIERKKHDIEINRKDKEKVSHEVQAKQAIFDQKQREHITLGVDKKHCERMGITKEKQKREYETQFEARRDTLQNLQVYLRELTNDLSKEKTELKSIQGNLLDAQDKRKKLKQEQTDLNSKIVKIKKNLTKSEERRDELNKQLVVVSQNIQNLNAKIQSVSRNIYGTKSKQELNKQRLANIGEEILNNQKIEGESLVRKDDIETETVSHGKKIEKLKIECSMEKDKVENINDSIEQQKQLLDGQNEEIAQRRAAIDTLDSKKDDELTNATKVNNQLTRLLSPTVSNNSASQSQQIMQNNYFENQRVLRK